MLVIVGMLVVCGAVMGGYLMAGGVLLVLVQPSEYVTICGAAIGSLLVSTSPAVLKGVAAQIKALFGAGTTKAEYNDLLAMLYQIFKQVQQSGVMSLEPHFENPGESTLLKKYPKFMARHEALDFLADSVKVIIVGGVLVAAIVATNHFVQLSTKYSCWLDGKGSGSCLEIGRAHV